MFLTAGLRITAFTCIILGIVNAVAMTLFLLSLPDPQSPREVYLTYAMLVTQAGAIAVGIGLFQMYRAAWISFWFVGFAAVCLAGEQTRWQIVQKDEIGSIPFVLAIDLVLWFVASGVCLLLPSSRKFYFNEPDSIRLHKKVVHSEAARSADVSGRPKKPVGVAFVAWTAAAIALGIFVFAMSVLGEPDSYEPAQAVPVELVGMLILYSACVLLSSVGLLRTRIWGWIGMLVCAIGAIGAALAMYRRGHEADSIIDLTLSAPSLLLCLVWCGAAILYLLLPRVRHPFFSRHRSLFDP